MNEIILNGIKVNELLEKIGQLIDTKIGTGFSQPQQKNQSKFLSRADVAGLLKISLPTLHEWSKLGLLQAYRIGTRVLYKQDEIELALSKTATFKYKKGGFRHA